VVTPKERREWIVGLARAARNRLDDAIDTFTDPVFSDAEVQSLGSGVEAAYYALYGERKTLRWLLFVRAIEKQTFVLRLKKVGRSEKKKKKSKRFLEDVIVVGGHVRVVPSKLKDVTIARRAIKEYGVVFPDAAENIDPKLVASAVHAWRADRDYFKAIRAALVSAYPDGETRYGGKDDLPNERSMSKKWSEFNKSTPWLAPSKNKKPRKPKRKSQSKAP
jgi:hypothetical protein